ncbi:MAG: transglycosylase [Micavibrio sp.]|nr:transglycosylase [Micavibrio sp.]|tara:strand:+ start:63 stop:473 length:411 start_codon:yes stop_codon:yes gene_type:complete
MSVNAVLAACLMLASQTYSVPPAVLVGIYKAEGGKVGQEVQNSNGSSDLGPMQINTIWLPSLAEKWGVKEDVAKKWLRDDACTNVNVAAWILRGHLDETGSLSQAIAHYHSRTPKHGTRYKKRVIDILNSNGLVKK